ncbi:MAG TPA: CopG family transcriptional regulator [Acidobacteria bacterium]|nr:CopG family transcriptional regulator [Acidobacteriota bacterium]
MEPVEKQNITLAIPKALLQKAKRIAVDRHQSVSGLLTAMIVDLVSAEESYAQARDRQLALLAAGLDLGTQGRVSWTRDELHER